MKKIIKRNVVTRKKGYMYYVDSQGNIGEVKMKHRKKKK